MSLMDQGLDVAALTALHDAIGDALKAAKAGSLDGLKAAKAESGTKQITVPLPDGRDVATITLVSPEPAAVVTDEDAFKAWVRKVYPDEIASRVVTEVRPAFRKKLLAEITAAGVPKVVVDDEHVDKETGLISGEQVVHDVPGVQLQGRASYQRLTYTKTGRADIAAAWRNGELAGLVLPELMPGGDR